MYSKPSVQTDESELKHRAVMIINVWRCCCLTGVSSAALEPGEKTSLRHHCLKARRLKDLRSWKTLGLSASVSRRILASVAAALRPSACSI